MGRRIRFQEKKFVGNLRTNEVHDLDNEKAGCLVDEIREPVTFDPDQLDHAHHMGYQQCKHCFEKAKKR